MSSTTAAELGLKRYENEAETWGYPWNAVELCELLEAVCNAHGSPEIEPARTLRQVSNAKQRGCKTPISEPMGFGLVEGLPKAMYGPAERRLWGLCNGYNGEFPGPIPGARQCRDGKPLTTGEKYIITKCLGRQATWRNKDMKVAKGNLHLYPYNIGFDWVLFLCHRTNALPIIEYSRTSSAFYGLQINARTVLFETRVPPSKVLPKYPIAYPPRLV